MAEVVAGTRHKHGAANVDLLIGNVWRQASDGAVAPYYNPADGSVLGHVALASADDLGGSANAARMNKRELSAR